MWAPAAGVPSPRRRRPPLLRVVERFLPLAALASALVRPAEPWALSRFLRRRSSDRREELPFRAAPACGSIRSTSALSAFPSELPGASSRTLRP